MIVDLPISTANFSALISKLKNVVGDEWVYTSDADMHLYRDAYSPKWGESDELIASSAVAPKTAEEVQQVVRLANEYTMPIYPVSTGKNLGYGSSAPSYSGSMIVDLKRMNKIIEVDDRRHFAIVEPGVSYFDLYNYIQENDLRVWIDCAEPGWGSLVGNALDHGIGWTLGEYRDHFRSHCGMEVVLPDGELMRTGMGALPGSDTWGQFPYNYGPLVDGLFSQGNYGIVTKMGFWLMPEPEAYKTCSVAVFRREDLIPLTDVITRLEHSQLVGVPLYTSPLTNRNDPELHALIADNGDVDNQEVNAYVKKNQLSMWECTLPFYGPEEAVAANIAYASRLLQKQIPDMQFSENELFRFPMSEEEKNRVPFKVGIGKPNLDAFGISARSEYNPNPADGHLLFAPVIPKTGEAVLEATRVLANLLKDAETPGYNPVFQPPQAFLFRSFVLIVGFPTSRTDSAMNQHSYDSYLKAIKICAEHGWGDYRTSPIFSDQITSLYSFNDNALLRFSETIKDALDPKGIIAPGRAGIWPKNIREKRG